MDTQTEQPAADALEQGQGEQGGDDESFYLPEFPGSKDLKPGSTITLKVVSNDEDGVAVEPVSEGVEESSEDDGGMMANYSKEVGS